MSMTASSAVQKTFMDTWSSPIPSVPSLLQDPCVTQGRPRLHRLAIEQARLEPAQAEGFTRRLIEPLVPARRLNVAGLHPAVGIDQEPQEHGAGLSEPDRSRRVRGL